LEHFFQYIKLYWLDDFWVRVRNSFPKVLWL